METTRIAYQVEGVCFGNAWRQLILIDKDKHLIVHLEPALLDGFRVTKTTETSTAENWPDMSVSSIKEWLVYNRTDGVRWISPSVVDDVMTRYLERVAKNA